MYYKISDIQRYCLFRDNEEIHVILSNKKNSSDCDNGFYSYRMKILLNPDVENGALYRVALWCEENCSGEWLVGRDTSGFVSETDAMAFKLRWL